MSSSSAEDVWSIVCAWLERQHRWSRADLAVDWRDIQGAGRGLVASRSVAPTSAILSVPPSCLLHVHNLYTLNILPPQWFPSRSFMPTNSAAPRKKQKSLHAGHQSGGTLSGSTLTSVQLLSVYLAINRSHSGSVSATPTPWHDYLHSLPLSFRPWHPLTWLVCCETDPPVDSSTLPPATNWTELAERLPYGAKEALHAVHRRWVFDLGVLRSALEVIKQEERDQYGLNDIQTEDILWGWLNVNTRAIYIRLDIPPFFQPNAPSGRAEQNNLTLCPLLDFANHCHSTRPGACKLELRQTVPNPSASTAKGPRIKSPWTWANTELAMLSPSIGLKEGDEVVFAYGSHSDEALFAEYGFVPFDASDDDAGSDEEESNPWAEVKVDAWFDGVLLGITAEEAEVGQAKRKLLAEKGYWGKYTLNSYPAPAHPDHRFLQALRLLHTDIPGSAIIRYLEDPSVPLTNARLSEFLALLNGQSDAVDPQVDRSARNCLTECCWALGAEADLRLANMKELAGDGEDEGDWTGAVASVQRLWRGQRRIAWAVKQSVENGVEF